MAAPIYVNLDAVARLMAVDSDADSLDNLNPIFGMDEVPDLSFEDAVKCAQVRKKRRVAQFVTQLYVGLQRSMRMKASRNSSAHTCNIPLAWDLAQMLYRNQSLTG